ncbi:MAG: tRNA (adenosine(37)-N6)-threonylcarbamoyltransferase complex ATPase subunit type 1 TsaE [bacterium]
MNNRCLVKVTRSEEETRKIGRAIGKSLVPGDIICLVGELGSGKTTITQGIAQGLGVRSSVSSASFKLINEYKGRIPLYHFDLFRLDKLSEVEELGYREYFYNQGVTTIEWAEKIRPLWPEERIEIELKIISEHDREIRITNLVGREIKLNGNSGNRDIN